MVKNLPANAGDPRSILGGEDPMEKGMATHSRILIWKIPQIEEPVGYSPGHCKEVDMTEQLLFTSSQSHTA